MLQLLIIWFLTIFSGLPAVSPNLPPKISLSIPQNSAVEGREFYLYVTILHSNRDVIDESSFLLDGKPFKMISFQKEKVAPQSLFKNNDEDSIEVSRYKGTLPARKAGLYTVGPLSVTVNNITYESGSISIDVQEAISSEILRLEMIPLKETKIFPGQEVTFGYRIYYQKPLQLTREELPLLNMKGFLNVGSPVITTEETSEGGMQTIEQKARAQRSGVYTVGQSVIEGLEIDTSDPEKRLVPPLYRASLNSMELNVLSFPEKNRPSAFDGALGSFVWRNTSLDGTNVKIGQTIRIEYRVSGRGDLSTIKFPAFESIVGLQDTFWTESLPPVGEEEEGVKRFILTLRPKRAGMITVPEFFTYSFDPVSERYLTILVPSIALKVEGSKKLESAAAENNIVLGKPLAPAYDLSEKNEPNQEISLTALFLIISGFLFIGILELFLFRKTQKKKPITSRKLFYEAIENRSRGYEGLKLLKIAFYRRLFEVGMTSKIEEVPDALPEEGLAGEVKGYLKSLDEALYRRNIAGENLATFFEEAIGLYQKLKQLQTLK